MSKAYLTPLTSRHFVPCTEAEEGASTSRETLTFRSHFVSTPVACGGGQSVANRSAVRGFPPLGRLRRLPPVVGTVRWKPYQERWLTPVMAPGRCWFLTVRRS
ncbi:hypothetical protein QUB80_02860 [Chlorogloeopsis sp. ULAP01]|uniref:hypothetical protein n=1 Tax=Chlorogloeopsis sp. ULAP01 TaxID=3056483 RepID=UPI0025AA47AB|nr:hypothetical protein [Chlorogloeopsis sp. ULAP01]MDM9379643.1 hypothetical protein [Chlorogloeopsis sp. ULAP01]